jgi:hypothetical protein
LNLKSIAFFWCPRDCNKAAHAMKALGLSTVVPGIGLLSQGTTSDDVTMIEAGDLAMPKV